MAGDHPMVPLAEQEKLAMDIPSLIVPIRQFCGGTLSAAEFEQWLYRTADLEYLLDHTLYLEAISANYSLDGSIRLIRSKLGRWIEEYSPERTEGAGTREALNAAHRLRLEQVNALHKQLQEANESRETERSRIQQKCEALLSEKDAQVAMLLKEKASAFPWLVRALTELELLHDLQNAEALERKRHPAVAESKRYREVAKEKHEAVAQYRIARHRLEYYEDLFPWLQEYVDADIDVLITEAKSQDVINEESDPASRFLAAGEYARLSPTERNQVALDRYWQSRRHSWQLGRDYERFVGYQYEQEGYSVRYHGIEEQLGDLGRDLICTKGDEVVVVQCKCWSKHKVIRERHVCQLYGTYVMHCLERHDGLPGLTRPKPVLVTSTALSDTAIRFAEALGVETRQNYDLQRYPCIKCNVSMDSQERIYHLPMDQQYDSVVIDKERGELYVSTVAEAERWGFRRAWRWRGERGES